MQQRSVVKVLVYTVITLGIYSLFWLESTRKELNKFGAKVPTIWLLIAPVLTLLVIALLQFISAFIFSSTSDGFSGTSASPVALGLNIISVIAGLVAVFGFIPLAIYWMVKYCRGVELATHGITSFGFSFGLWLITSLFSVFFIWPAIIQDAFNKIQPVSSEAPSAPNVQS